MSLPLEALSIPVNKLERKQAQPVGLPWDSPSRRDEYEESLLLFPPTLAGTHSPPLPSSPTQALLTRSPPLNPDAPEMTARKIPSVTPVCTPNRRSLPVHPGMQKCMHACISAVVGQLDAHEDGWGEVKEGGRERGPHGRARPASMHLHCNATSRPPPVMRGRGCRAGQKPGTVSCSCRSNRCYFLLSPSLLALGKLGVGDGLGGPWGLLRCGSRAV
jgi:hypothetical protein